MLTITYLCTILKLQYNINMVRHDRRPKGQVADKYKQNQTFDPVVVRTDINYIVRSYTCLSLAVCECMCVRTRARVCVLFSLGALLVFASVSI